MINFIDKVVRKTGETVIGMANSGLVRGASKLGATGVKGGFEGAAFIGNKVLEGVRDLSPKVKNFDGKAFRGKASSNIGKVSTNTLVGDNYQTIGKAVNESKIGKTWSEHFDFNLMNEDAKVQLRGSRKTGPRANAKTTYTSDGSTLGLVDAVTDRAKLYMDGVAHVARGDSFVTGYKPLLKTGTESYLGGVKATGLGTSLFVGGSLVSGVPDAAKKWNESKQGTNQDSQPVSIAPRTPAYAQNGGATGDLVFALNNLRHGGMM